MSQPEPIPSFAVNLLRCQVPTDTDHPNGEAVIVEFTPIENGIQRTDKKCWFMCPPGQAIEFGQGIIAEGELARTGLVIPPSW